MRIENGAKIVEPMTLAAYLVGDVRMKIGDITLDKDLPIDQFATAAYRKAQGSLKRLMQPKWRVVIVDQRGNEHGFGLEKWNKLVSNQEIQEKRLAAFKRATAKAAKIYGFAPE